VFLDFLETRALCMRRMIVLLILFIGIIIPTQAQSEITLEAEATARLKLRAGPGQEWPVLDYVEAGETLVLDGRAPDDAWWVHVITTDDQVGWVAADFIAASGNQIRSLPVVEVDENLLLTPTATPPLIVSFTPNSTGTPQATALPNRSSTIVSGMGENARNIFLRGQQLGNRANVFSKVGDSITASRHFLFPIGWGTYNLRGYSDLQAVVNYFSSASARDGNNSFANPSLAAYDGLTTAGVLSPDVAWKEVCLENETPLECEYRVVQPSVALIMLGTNDVVLLTGDAYRANLERIVQISMDRGVVPVLSLIPMRIGYEGSAAAFNQIISDVANAYAVPLWRFSLQGLENNGLADGVHPSWPSTADDYAASADLSTENLRFGYPVRNLSALQALDAVWRGVLY
jgi:lysophospholipase L1-like esterase